MKMMKASVFNGIENMVTMEVGVPECEKDGVLVKVYACGICGSDIRNYHTGLRGGIEKQIIGHEIAGVVYEAGKEVRKFKEGDRVAIAPDVSCGECYYCKRGLVNLCTKHKMVGTHFPGGFAQYVYLPHEVLQRGMVHHIPQGLGFDEATLSEPASSVIASQENNNITLGETVAIIGDGPIGCLHIEVARARGASKIIMSGLTRLDSAAQFMPDLLIDAGKDVSVARVLEYTDGLGCDAVIIANPAAETQEQGLEMVRKRGRVIIFGGVNRNNPFTRLNSNLIHYNEITVVGAFSYPGTTHETALKLISQGKIDARKFITQYVSLEEIPMGIKYAEEGKALKVVVRPWE